VAAAAATAAGMRPPRPVDWATAGASGAAEVGLTEGVVIAALDHRRPGFGRLGRLGRLANGQRERGGGGGGGRSGGRWTESSGKGSGWNDRRSKAERAECDVDMGNAAEASEATAAAAAEVRPPRPSN